MIADGKKSQSKFKPKKQKMSVFHLTSSQLKDNLDELPTHHTKEDILRLIEALQTDIKNDPPEMTFTQKVHKHADAHKELFLAYPMLFRTICKGTYRQVVLDILLDAKEAIESGRKTKKEALDNVIKEAVDEVTALRQQQKTKVNKNTL